MSHRVFICVLLLLIFVVGCASKQTDLIKKAKVDARDLVQKGNESLAEGKYDEAARFYDRARFIAISIDDLVARADADNNLGHLFLMAGDTSNAGRKFREALEWSETIDYRAGVAAANNGLGLIETKNGNYGSAENYLATALSDSKKGSLRAAIKSNLGNLKYLTGDMANATLYLNEALSESLKLKRHRLAAVAAYRLALVEKSESNLDGAMEMATTALEEDKKVEFAPGIVKDLELLSEISFMMGNGSAADLYNRRAEDAKTVLAGRR